MPNHCERLCNLLDELGIRACEAVNTDVPMTSDDLADLFPKYFEPLPPEDSDA